MYFTLFLEIEDDNEAGRGGAQPVAVGREGERMHLVAGVQRIEVLGLVEIPEHGRTVFSARRAERAIGRDGDGVDVARVADVVGLNAARG